jgi:hypothetical protein
MKLMRGVLVLVLASGCSSKNSSSGADAGSGSNSSDCMVTLSGAQSVTAACVAAFQQEPDGTSDWGGAVTMEPAGFSEITASFQVNGAPAMMTYTPADFTEGGVSVVTTSDQTYVASNTPVASGTLGPLVITGLTEAGGSGSAVDYFVHGSFTATLAQQGSGSAGGGTVMLSMTF